MLLSHEPTVSFFPLRSIKLFSVHRSLVYDTVFHFIVVSILENTSTLSNIVLLSYLITLTENASVTLKAQTSDKRSG